MQAISQYSPTVLAMCIAGLAVLAVGVWRARGRVAAGRGIDKLTALAGVFVAVPLVVFGATHLFDPQSLLLRVPSYMPVRPAWVLVVGCALIATAASLAARVAVRWSGLLFGIMMFLFVAMLHLPGAIRQGVLVLWTIVVRELSFGGGAWLLAADAAPGWPESRRRALAAVGRALVTLALLVFGIEHFFHPLGLPVVPLRQEMPTWVPAPKAIGYLTGALLVVAAASVALRWKTRRVTTWLGAWIVLLVLALYGPIMVLALAAPGDQAQVVAIDFFVDTLLFGGVVLALAQASPAER